MGIFECKQPDKGMDIGKFVKNILLYCKTFESATYSFVIIGGLHCLHLVVEKCSKLQFYDKYKFVPVGLSE